MRQAKMMVKQATGWSQIAFQGRIWMLLWSAQTVKVLFMLFPSEYLLLGDDGRSEQACIASLLVSLRMRLWK